jgi:hypothetical protein
MPFVTAELEEPFARYVRATLAPARSRYGFEPRGDDPEDVHLMRPELIAWLGAEGDDPEVVAYCEARAEKYMQDPATLDPTIAGAVLSVAAVHGDRARFEKFRAKFEASTVPADRSRYLSALGRFTDPALQDEVLEYAVTDKVRVMDRWQLVSGMFKTEAGRDKLYVWMTKHYEQLAGELPAEMQSMFPYFVSGCERQRLDAAKKFFEEPAHRVDGTDATLAKVTAQIGDCLSLRQREGAAVTAYLKALAP